MEGFSGIKGKKAAMDSLKTAARAPIPTTAHPATSAMQSPAPVAGMRAAVVGVSL